MAWIWLALAGVLEIGWAVLLKQSQGLTRPGPALGAGALMLASVALLSLAVRTLPLGTAYAIWTGIGAAGAFLAGIAFYGEPVNGSRVLAVLLLLAGLVLLKRSAGA